MVTIITSSIIKIFHTNIYKNNAWCLCQHLVWESSVKCFTLELHRWNLSHKKWNIHGFNNLYFFWGYKREGLLIKSVYLYVLQIKVINDQWCMHTCLEETLTLTMVWSLIITPYWSSPLGPLSHQTLGEHSSPAPSWSHSGLNN